MRVGEWEVRGGDGVLGPSFVRNGSKNLMKKFAQQQATWISGPSFPSHNPDATARHYCQPLPHEGGNQAERFD